MTFFPLQFCRATLLKCLSGIAAGDCIGKALTTVVLPMLMPVRDPHVLVDISKLNYLRLQANTTTTIE